MRVAGGAVGVQDVGGFRRLFIHGGVMELCRVFIRFGQKFKPMTGAANGRRSPMTDYALFHKGEQVSQSHSTREAVELCAVDYWCAGYGWGRWFVFEELEVKEVVDE